MKTSPNPKTLEQKPKDAAAYLNRGNEKYNLKDYPGAIADYDAAIRLNPAYADAYNNRGNAKSDLGDNPGAIADYDAAIRLNPAYADAYNNRGIAKRALGDNPGAIADYDAAIRLNPAYADAYMGRGIAKDDLKNYPGAIEDYDAAIRLNPAYAAAYYNRGIAKRALGDNPGAIADYDAAIRLNPAYALAYYNRGIAKRALGDNPGAIADYDAAIRLNPAYALAYYNRGIAKRALGDNPGAIADYDAAIRLNPAYADAYMGRGIAKRALGDNPGAIADYDAAIRLNPAYADAYMGRGIAKDDLKNYPGAIEDYDAAIRLNPAYADAYYNRGIAKCALGDNPGAIADYDAAIRLNPAKADAYNNRGIAKRALGDNPGAIADYAAAFRLEPQNPKRHQNLESIMPPNPQSVADFQQRVWVQQALGQPREALQEWERCLQQHPQCVEAYQERGQLYEQLKDTRSALADYAAAFRLEPQNPKRRQNLESIMPPNPQSVADFQQRVWIQQALGQPREALQEWERCLQQHPQCVEAYQERVRLLEQLGEYALAQRDKALLQYLEPNLQTTQFEHQGLNRIWQGKYPQAPVYTPIAPKTSGSYPGALYEKAHTSPSPKTAPKRWLGKPGVKEDFGNQKGSALEGRLIRRLSRDAMKEKIAADCYEALRVFTGSGYQLPKHRLAWLPISNDYTREHPITASLIAQIRAKAPQATHTAHVMSKIVVGYQDLSQARVRGGAGLQTYEEALKSGKIPDSIVFEEKDIPLLGLIELLAAGRLLADIDVLGNELTNAGFVVVREGATPLYASIVKIDPGWAFSFGSEKNRFYNTSLGHKAFEGHPTLEDLRDLQVGTGDEDLVLPWSALNPSQRERFLLTLHLGVELLNHSTVLEYLIVREGRFNQGAEPGLMKPEWSERYRKNIQKNALAQRKVYQTDWHRFESTLPRPPADALAQSFSQLGLGQRVGPLSAFHQAVKEGNLDKVRSLFTPQALHDQYNPAGDTPLHLAVRHQHLAIVCFLLNNRADPHRVNRQYATPLSLIERERLSAPDIVRQLLRHPAPVQQDRLRLILEDTLKRYHGSRLEEAHDRVLLNHAVGLLLGQSDTVETKKAQRKLYLAHLQSMKGGQHQNLEGMFISDFLSLRVLSYLELWLKHTKRQPDLPPTLSKALFLETLETEILLACETFKWHELIQTACLSGQDTHIDAVLDNFIDRLRSLSDQSSLIFPTSRPGHCIYATFSRHGNELWVRIDNLWHGDVQGRHLSKGQSPDTQQPLVYPYLLKKVPLSEINTLKAPILSNLLQAIRQPDMQRALQLIYPSSRENTLENLTALGYPALEVQLVENCVVYSYSVGLQCRLSEVCYQYLVEKESALFLAPSTPSATPPAIKPGQLPLRGAAPQAGPFSAPPPHDVLMRYFATTLGVPYEQVLTGYVVEQALINLAGLSDNQTQSSYRSFPPQGEVRFQLCFNGPPAVEQFTAYYREHFGRHSIMKPPQALKSGLWEISFDTLVLTNEIIPRAVSLNQQKRGSCTLA